MRSKSDIEYQARFGHCRHMMKKLILPLLVVVAGAVAASSATAECYADFKAKRDNPLRLQYGVIELPDSACSKDAAAQQIASRIGADGWQLLTVLSLFGPEGLEQRKAQAGQFFLKY